MISTKALIQLVLIFNIVCSEIDNDRGAVINLDRQSPTVLKEIKNAIMYYRRMPQHEFETEYLIDNSNKEGFHMMRVGSDLEGFFTISFRTEKFKNDKNYSNLRLLYKIDGKTFKEARLVGLVDLQTDNVKLWNSIPKDNKKEFFKIKNIRGDTFGVKSADTIVKDEL
jgi:hypothetical protein